MSEIRSLDVEATGKRIQETRVSYGVTVKSLAAYFGFGSLQAIYKWEAGKSLPTVDNFLALAHFYTKLSGKKYYVEDFAVYIGDSEDSGCSQDPSLEGSGCFLFIHHHKGILAA